MVKALADPMVSAVNAMAVSVLRNIIYYPSDGTVFSLANISNIHATIENHLISIS